MLQVLGLPFSSTNGVIARPWADDMMTNLVPSMHRIVYPSIDVFTVSASFPHPVNSSADSIIVYFILIPPHKHYSIRQLM